MSVGFSGKGKMVGSSAVAGWASSGRGTVKQYYLGGKSPDECSNACLNRDLLLRKAWFHKAWFRWAQRTHSCCMYFFRDVCVFLELGIYGNPLE